MILMNPAPASEADYKQLRNDWLEKRAADMERRKAMADTAAYKEADSRSGHRLLSDPLQTGPGTLRGLRKAHHKNAGKFIPQGNAGILKARAVESCLMTETWALSGYDLLPKLKTVSIPTVVIYGDHDFIPAATAEHITQALPNAHMVTLKDCGHFTYLEYPVAARKQIDSFFAGKKKHAH